MPPRTLCSDRQLLFLGSYFGIAVPLYCLQGISSVSAGFADDGNTATLNERGSNLIESEIRDNSDPPEYPALILHSTRIEEWRIIPPDTRQVAVVSFPDPVCFNRPELVGLQVEMEPSIDSIDESEVGQLLVSHLRDISTRYRHRFLMEFFSYPPEIHGFPTTLDAGIYVQIRTYQGPHLNNRSADAVLAVLADLRQIPMHQVRAEPRMPHIIFLGPDRRKHLETLSMNLLRLLDNDIVPCLFEKGTPLKWGHYKLKSL